MERASVFNSRVAEPLDSVLGQALLDVDYWVLESDEAGFSEEQPNNSGVMVVRLRFAASTIMIAPGWEKPLRGDGIYHHVQVFYAGQAEDKAAQYLCKIAAVQAAPWQLVLGKRLTHVEVLGLQDSPQGIRFSFSDVAVVVATGYSGSDLLVGDGDELLVFSGQEWPRRSNTHAQEWERLWAASAVVSDALLVK